jgi:hypothetical protein
MIKMRTSLESTAGFPFLYPGQYIQGACHKRVKKACHILNFGWPACFFIAVDLIPWRFSRSIRGWIWPGESM